MTLFIVTLSLLWASVLADPINSEFTDVRAGADVDTIFYELYTRKNPTAPQILRSDDVGALSLSHFNPQVLTKFFSHGWISNSNKSYTSRDGYLEVEDCNFIAMDWSEMASGPLPYPSDYPFVAEVQVPKAGQNAAEFVDFLVSNTGAAIGSFHLIGHSLGSHIVGWIGSLVTSGRITRITGLDPAAPFFSLNNTETRLDTSDAEFVDVIHTNSGNLVEDQLSFVEAIGNIDYYPNGGTVQPGCDTSLGEEDCSHERAVTYFAESVASPIGFKAWKCDSYEDFNAGLCSQNEVEFMGEPTLSTSRGVYYLKTNREPPFAIEDVSSSTTSAPSTSGPSAAIKLNSSKSMIFKLVVLSVAMSYAML